MSKPVTKKNRKQRKHVRFSVEEVNKDLERQITAADMVLARDPC